MKITKLSLKNFRNHKKASFEFKRSNLILGPNGSGKTSTLEAISFASTLRSPRTSRAGELVTWGENQTFVEARVANKNRKNTLRFLIEKNARNKGLKSFSLDGKTIEAKEAIGFIRTVYFSPETLEIITGSPHLRRRFLDIFLSQISPRYLSDLIEYKKVIVNRNRLIKDISEERRGREELFFWNERLVLNGSRIMDKRRKVIKKLSLDLDKYYKEISGNSKSQAGLNYLPSVKKEKGRLTRNCFRDKLEQEFETELRYKSTLVGPHRDDLSFLLNKHGARTFCSRGEVRSLIISLKLAEANYIFKETKDQPIILLDDIFSELDQDRALFLSKAILGDNQVITTTSDRDLIEKLGTQKTKLIELGRVGALKL